MKYNEMTWGRMEAIINKLGGFEGAERFLRDELVVTEKTFAPILRRLFEGETITIAQCDGFRYIGTQKETFVYIDSYFDSWGLNKSSKQPTDATNVSVHEMIKDATFAQMFGTLGSDLDKLCLTQAQIIEYCEKHRDKFRQEGGATFFLFKEGDQFFVAYVYVRSAGLHVHVRPFGHGYVWLADCALRVVTPQLIL